MVEESSQDVTTTPRTVSVEKKGGSLGAADEARLRDASGGRASEGLLSVAPVGTILWASPEALQLLGVREDECLGRHVGEFQEDRGEAEEALAELRAGRPVRPYRTHLPRGNRTGTPVLLTFEGVYDRGMAKHFLCFVRDAGAGSEAEVERSLYARIVADSCDAVISQSLDGIVTSWNKGAERLLGYTADEIVGRAVSAFVPGGRLGEEGSINERIRRGDKIPPFETLRRHKDGSIVDVWLTVSPVIDADGTVVGSSMIARDNTSRKRAEQELQATVQRYRSLSELLPVGICTYEAVHGDLTYCNREASRIIGREPTVGDPVERYCRALKLIDPDTGERVPQEASPPAIALVQGRRYVNEEAVLERPDGSAVAVLLNIEPILEPDGRVRGTITTLQDVTATKEAESALREQRAERETLLDIVPVAVFIAQDPECRVISGNRRAAELLQLPVDANFSMSAPPPESPPLLAFRDGEPVLPERLPVQRAASTGETVSHEPIDLELADGTLIHTLISAAPLYDVAGNPVGAIACMLDVTDLINSERALREADRRKDEFLATLSHELRNPLAPILTGLEIMRMVDEPAVREQTLGMMERQTRRLIRLVDELLDVARLTRGWLELQPVETDVAAIVQDGVETARPWIEQAEHSLDIDLPREPIGLVVDPDRIEQVVSNLLINAAQFTPRRGRIALSCERDGEDVVIRVQDTGIGIPKDRQGQIFEMFTQVDRPHERGHNGLGVGLTLAKSLVEMHQGTLTAASPGAGQGSTFVVRMPTHPRIGQAEPVEPTGGESEEATSLRRVLIVDDNEAFVEALSVVIETLGHEVRTACDGRRALEAGADFRPDVVLMDLGMPGLNGYEAARLIRKEPWGTDVLLVALTGWGQEEEKERTREAGFDHHLVKPARAADLERLLAS